MKTPAVFGFLIAAAVLGWGQTPASPADVCAKNVSFAVAEGGQPVPAIPKFTSKWIDKKLHQPEYRVLCLSQIPSSSVASYVVIFSTSNAMFEGLTASAHTYTSATPGSGNITTISSYGGTWSYYYASGPPPKTTTTPDLRRDDKPKSLFVRAYNQQGRVVSSGSLTGFPSREKLLEHVLAGILGDVAPPQKQKPMAVPLSVYYVNCDVDSPPVQTAMEAPPSTLPAEAPSKPPPPLTPLEISSSPAGADISLDGVNIGKTPYSLVVPRGEHTIILRKQDFGTWQRTVRVDASKRRVVAYLDQKALALEFPSGPALPPVARKDPGPEAILDFWSSPTGADVFLDGGYVGKTPYSLVASPGEHTITLRKKDFGTWQHKVVAAPGKRSVGGNLERKTLKSTPQ